MGHTHENVTALIALGANLAQGDTGLTDTLTAAFDALGANVEILDQSRIYHTPCFPAGAGPDYLNAAASVVWGGDSNEFLAMLHSIEQDFGRRRDMRWGARALDLDLLSHCDRVAPDLATYHRWANLPLADQMTNAPDQLILPHPRIPDRAFVLGPLIDIAPDWKHPVTGLTTTQMWDALPAADRAAIHPV